MILALGVRGFGYGFDSCTTPSVLLFLKIKINTLIAKVAKSFYMRVWLLLYFMYVVSQNIHLTNHFSLRTYVSQLQVIR